MRNKKLVIPVLLFLLVLSFAGCADRKAGLSIKTQIYEYSPMMSSTPGIPLIAQFTRDLKNKNYKYHWVAEQGTFLKWNDKGQGRQYWLFSFCKTGLYSLLTFIRIGIHSGPN